MSKLREEVPVSFERPGAEMDKRKGDIPPASAVPLDEINLSGIVCSLKIVALSTSSGCVVRTLYILTRQRLRAGTGR